MNERVKLVLQILKPKVKSLGFNATELKGVAERIANNLKAGEDADEDELKEEIETAVATAVPYLEMAQRNANRVIDEHRRKANKKGSSDEGNDDDDDDEGNDDDDNKKTPKWLKSLNKRLDSIENRFNGWDEGRKASSRKQKLEALVKDAGSYGKRILKDFDKRKFENDDEFEEYLDDIKDDVKNYTTEMEQAGLKGMVVKGSGGNKGGDPKELSDKDIDDIVNELH